jgi:hypothetical protein
MGLVTRGTESRDRGQHSRPGGLPVLGAAVCALTVVVAAALSGCGGLNTTTKTVESPGKFEQPGKAAEKPVAPAAGSTVIRLRSGAGEKIRTRRKMVVTEMLEGGQKIKATVDEAYLQTVLRVDADSAPVLVNRLYERYETSVEKPGGEAQRESGPLEGSEIELSQREDGVTARVISGKANSTQLAGMLISGFDAALLPAGQVASGDTWKPGDAAMAGFAAVVRGLGVETEKSSATCRYIGETEKNGLKLARVAVDWQLTGTIRKGSPVVFRLSGEIAVDVKRGFVSTVEFTGGRVLADGRVEQAIAISITREAVEGWYG